MLIKIKNIRERIKNLFREIMTQRGFTLIEIMIVVTIIAILIGLVAVPGLLKKPDTARVTAAKVKITQLSLPLLEYSQINGRFPTTEEGLEILVTEGLIKQKDTLDPWGNPYGYRYPGEHDSSEFEIWSYGADGKEGGTGVNADILSWEIGQ